ncbi:LANO_0H04522g1_1 [Lachancea nothofagi CBS 11611]|uniref:LANO_0H04522g1_1 n=1 Tax=Lachancea nothofagi CBS 11611 TaxID=1266666 RepID=A0A1G4KLE0_9SACH|nr:LANO_0H04522g1_1 [Lachancea nothofagi CBS 11611]
MGDPKISTGSYTQKSFLSLRDGGSGRHKLGSPSSRTSLSQLQLNLLADGKHWEFLDDYGLEELRDGFFDPIFTEHKPLLSQESDDNADDTIKQHPTDSPSMLSQQWHRNQWNKLIECWQPMFKFWVAFFAAFCICLVRPAGSWIGHSHRYFLPLAVLIHHPARNVGVQLEICVWSIIGAAFGMGWSSLAWYVSVATKPTASHQGGILFASLFIAVYLSSWLIASNQRLLYLALSYGIAVTFFHTVSLVDNKALLQWNLYWDFGISYLFGLVLSFLVCVIVFPHSGQSEVVGKFSISVSAIKELLVKFLELDECSNLDELHKLKKKIGRTIDFDVSEGVREFLNQITVTKIDEKSLLEFRNNITNAAAPLRSLPTDHKLVTKLELEKFYAECQNKYREGNVNTSTMETPVPVSGCATPLPRTGNFPNANELTEKEMYISVLRSTFSKEIISLIVEMIGLLECIELALRQIGHAKLSSQNRPEVNQALNAHVNRLLHKIRKLDQSYKKFTKSNFFCKEMLSDPQSIDSFLFLRYVRQSAKYLISIASCTIEISSKLHWQITLPHYSLRRALKRLPYECSVDQGAKTLLHYFQTKSDVDDVFEELYNSYTSRHETFTKNETEKNKVRTTVRAVDHKDFSLHTTSDPLRYKLWLWSSEITSNESKWALKIAAVMTFLALPSWLPESYHWYQEYQCWWAPLSFFILVNRRNTGNWASFNRRLACTLLGIFWGWCANQARHFGSPYVIATFASIFCAFVSYNFFANKNRKSSFTGFMCFTVIALEGYSKGESQMSQALIWKNTWVTGVALLCGILPSIPINWVLWSFTARQEFRASIAFLLAHIGQSYQSVTDRYLYRDADDAPTELTLKFSNIREVRMSQSLIGVREMLRKARTEPNYIFVFKADKYQHLLDECEILLEKMIEARISGQHFEVWENDNDSGITRALLSLRRDSVASVIFVLYMLSNCFTSKHKIPTYLPNSIMSRKKLFDFISKFDSGSESRSSTAVGRAETTSKDFKADRRSSDYDISHWTQIHGMAFARAFTDISEVVQRIVQLSREILGEETCT